MWVKAFIPLWDCHPKPVPLQCARMKWFLVTALVSVAVASPFLTSRALGTGEAYNYSLATADAVSQVRAGVWPVLVGQTEFAFNGRLHPLRNAPLLAYAAIALDCVTLRRLDFWTLQNLTLALALTGAGLACHRALVRHTAAPPPLASLLASAYLLCPALLAAAHGMDLYMTVIALPFVPLAIGAAVSCLQGRSSALLALAVTLAACWLAHPPVAFWTTAATLPLVVAGLWWRPPPAARTWWLYPAALALFVVLAGFVFASAWSAVPPGNIGGDRGANGIAAVVALAAGDSLLPVSATADRLGDFQLGWTLWVLTIACLLAARRQRHRPALCLLLVGGGLLCFLLPVPALNAWLWRYAPGLVVNLTGQWPMQRLYLPLAALIVFSAALVWRPGALRPRPVRFAVALGVLWMAGQAAPFVRRGFATRQSAEDTARSHASGNLDLTQIAYAFLPTPGDYVRGVRDPAYGLRLLAPFDLHEVATNWQAPLPVSAATVRGELFAGAPVSLTLQPGIRYRLDLEFLAPPFAGSLTIRGPLLARGYPLPSAGRERGFGMAPGNVPQLSLWTDLPVAETVALTLDAPGAAADSPLARFTLNPVPASALPLRLQSLMPLRAHVQAGTAGYLETPRVYLPDYRATVEGEAVPIQPSPEGLLLVPVPAGESEVVVSYDGPWYLRAAFRFGLAGWLGVGVLVLVRRWGRPGWRLRLPPRWVAAGLVGALLAAGAGAALAWWPRDEGVGPMRIRFFLPRGETNRSQPLLVSGRTGDGTFVYVRYIDDRHVVIGVDVWGRLGAESGPIETDYWAAHELTVTHGGLYPRDHPRLADVPAKARARLHQELEVRLDGREVLSREIEIPAAGRGAFFVGRNPIGGSSCEPAFAGRILSAERLPVSPP